MKFSAEYVIIISNFENPKKAVTVAAGMEEMYYMVMEGNYVAAVVLSGLALVFSALLILILFVWIIGKVFDAINASKAAKSKEAVAVQAPKAAPVQQTLVAAVDTDDDSDEIAAVIAAAIEAIGVAEGKKLAVRGIRRVQSGSGRSPWAAAAAQENMHRF